MSGEASNFQKEVMSWRYRGKKSKCIQQLMKVLYKLYSEVEYNVDGSIAYFKCVK